MATDVREVSLRFTANDTTAGVFANIDKRMHQLKQTFGRRGALGEFSELFMGGAAFGGITYLTRHLAGAADRAVELRDQFAAGEITAGQFADKIAASIPILGSVYTIFKDIGELMTGNLRYQKELNEEAKRFAQQELESRKAYTGTMGRSASQSKEGLSSTTASRCAARNWAMMQIVFRFSKFRSSTASASSRKWMNSRRSYRTPTRCRSWQSGASATSRLRKCAARRRRKSILFRSCATRNVRRKCKRNIGNGG